MILAGGDGIDTLSCSDDSSGVTVNLFLNKATGGFAAGDFIGSFENVEGGSSTDVLTGSSGVNTLTGNDGNDFLDGGEDDDVLNGGPGNDTVIGGLGADQLDGGAGIDTLDYRESDAAVSINLGNGTASGGHAAGDIITAFEAILGSDFADTLVGDGNANALEGGANSDIVNGGAGDASPEMRIVLAGTVNLTAGGFRALGADAL